MAQVGVRSKQGRALPSNRKPLAKVEGRRRLRLSGFTIVWRGTPGVDDWVAYIAEQPKSKRLILLDGAAERRVKTLLSRLQTMPKRAVEKLAMG